MTYFSRDKINEIIKTKPDGFSDEQIIQGILDRGHTIEGLSEPPEEKKLLGADLNNRVSNVVQEAGQNVRQAIEGTGEYEGQSTVRRGFGATAEAFTAIPEVAVAAAPKPVRDIVGQVGETVGKGFNKLVNFIGSNKELQKFVMENPDVAKGIEEVAGTLQSSGEIAGTILGTRELTKNIDTTLKVSDDLIKSTLRQAEKPADTVTPQTIIATAKSGNPEMYTQAKNKLVETYSNSIITTPTAKKKLDNLALAKGVDSNKLIEEFVESGGFANRVDDDGRVYFTETKRDFAERKDQLGEAISEYMSRQTELTDLNSLRQSALDEVKNRGEVFGYNKSVAEINKLFDDAEAQFGTNQITPLQLHQLRIKANERFPSDPENYEVDAYTAIGDAARSRIDQVVGDERIREANAAWGNLAEQERIIPILEGQKVDVGLLNESFGSYVGASAVGTAGLAVGSGSLVIAGLASTLGQKAFANWIRRKRINDPEVQQVLNIIRQDQQIANQLIEDIKQIDAEAAARIEQGLLLPSPGNTSAPIQLPQGNRAAGTPIEINRTTSN